MKWALERGRAALFEDCGLGKTPQQLEWADQICKKEKEPVLILAPLAVSRQTYEEGKKFNIKVNICKSDKDIKNGINITNYEKLHKFKLDVIARCLELWTKVEINRAIELGIPVFYSMNEFPVKEKK